MLKRISHIAAVVCLLLFSMVQNGAAQKVRDEAEVKAAYIYNFAHFVSWPEGAFTNKTEPFIVAVLGEDPFGKELEKALETEKAKGRSFSIIRTPTGSSVPHCHILFIGASEKERLSSIFQDLDNKPILTVSEVTPFARIGGMIRFSKENRRISLIINPETAKKAGLRIRSELLSIATLRTK